MSTELIPILALAVMFLAATVLPVNMGALGFVAAFFVGTLSLHMSSETSSPDSPAACSSRWSASPTSSRSPRTTAPST